MKFQKFLFLAIGAMNIQNGLANCSFRNCDSCQTFLTSGYKNDYPTFVLKCKHFMEFGNCCQKFMRCDVLVGCIPRFYKHFDWSLWSFRSTLSTDWALLPIWLWFEKLFCNGLQINVQNLHFTNLTYPSMLIALHSLFSRFSYGFISQYVKSTPDCRKATQAR